jgi:hypothetical protein
MNNTIVAAIVALVISLSAAFLGYPANPTPSQTSDFGGLVELKDINFVNGFRVGRNETRVMDSSGNFTIPGTFTASGALTAESGDVTIDTLVQSGGVKTVASGSTTYTAADMCDNTLVRHSISNAPASAQNFKLPTAAALIADCLPTAGDFKNIMVENNSESSTEILTFVKGTGIDLGVASGSSAGPGTQKAKLDKDQRAIVQLTNLNGSSVSFDFTKIVDGD